MCGIAGVFGRGSGRVDFDALRTIIGALAHRGPDGSGFHEQGEIGLGHRRLAVIDVEGGAQPLYSRNRELAVVVNGEIYNYRALRAELIDCGHAFVTDSDSEVVVHGFAEWGQDCLDRLEGQFAFAVWDQRDRKLTLARDRMGEKPLYYAITGEGDVVFASELAAMLSYPGVNRRVDRSSLAHYLVYEHVPAPMAMVEDAVKLAPATAVVFDSEHTTTTHYWHLPITAAPRLRELRPAGKELRAALGESVRSRLVADVPLGVFLSGGLDSSLVAALAVEFVPNVETFSIAFEDPSYDESMHASAVAKHLGTRHHEHRVTSTELLVIVEELGSLLDEPLGDSSLIPTYALAKFARQHVTVALGGDGADELFGGYPTFFAESIVGKMLDRSPDGLVGPFAMMAEVMLSRLPPSTGHFAPDFIARQLIRGATSDVLERHVRWLASFLPAELDEVLLEPNETDVMKIVHERDAPWRDSNRWSRLLSHYALGFLGDGVLTKVDRASMAVGLEVRAPMLDRNVIAIACECNPRLTHRGRPGKRVLRSAARGLLPNHIIDRSKHGFAMPIAEWLRTDLRQFIDELLSVDRLDRDGLFNTEHVRKMLKDHVAGTRDYRKPLWTLLAFHVWLDSSLATP